MARGGGQAGLDCGDPRSFAYKPNERAAVMRHGVGLLVVAGAAPSPDLARAFVATLPRIERFLGERKRPFIAKVGDLRALRSCVRQPPAASSSGIPEGDSERSRSPRVDSLASGRIAFGLAAEQERRGRQSLRTTLSCRKSEPELSSPYEQSCASEWLRP
jgi:hypothetical protein